MNLSGSTGLLIKPWPVLLDHYNQPIGKLPGFASSLLFLQLVDQIHHTAATHSLAPAHCIASQGDGQVGFTRPGSTDQLQIVLLFLEVAPNEWVDNRIHTDRANPQKRTFAWIHAFLYLS
ncbi:hypothetical protein [Aeromonas hydrophila]